MRDASCPSKPAKTGTETNLNLITTSGQVYAFLLSEVSETKGVEPDLTVYLDRDDTDPPTTAGGCTELRAGGATGRLQGAAELARDQATRATTAAGPTSKPRSRRFAPRIRRAWSSATGFSRTNRRSSCGPCGTTTTARSFRRLRRNCPLYEYQDRMPALR